MYVKIEDSKVIKVGDVCDKCNSPYKEVRQRPGFGNVRKGMELKCKCPDPFDNNGRGWRF